MNLICRGCNYQRNSSDGICLRKSSPDGLAIRCAGEWSKTKHHYLQKYIGIFTKAMRKKWPLFYADLFAGPGRCRVRETGEEIDGSPIIALNTRYPFEGYFFVDQNQDILDALSQRCSSSKYRDRVVMRCGDANEEIDVITSQIPRDSLSLAFIDPTGLHFNFATAQKLSARKVDLIIIFPEGMAMRRNIKKFLTQAKSPLDDWMGCKEWRQLYDTSSTNKETCRIERTLMEYYKSKLKSIGYLVDLSYQIVVRSGKNVPLYYLFFASKDPMGIEFWKKICKIDHKGQRQLL